MQETTLVYLLFDGIGPPCPGWKEAPPYLTQQWMRSYGSMGRMGGGERDVGGLRDKGVSRHP